jgi:hypothetical protein
MIWQKRAKEPMAELQIPKKSVFGLFQGKAFDWLVCSTRIFCMDNLPNQEKNELQDVSAKSRTGRVSLLTFSVPIDETAMQKGHSQRK